MVTESEMILSEVIKDIEESNHTNWTKEEIVDFLQSKIDIINGVVHVDWPRRSRNNTNGRWY